MARPGEDRWANIMSASVVQSAADTLTFTEVVTGVSLGQGVGILIDRIEYTHNGTVYMTATSDIVQMGWSTSDNLTASDLILNNNRVIHTSKQERWDLGAAASGLFLHFPLEYDFTPPIIVASSRLYLFCYSAGLGNVVTLQSRIYFRYINLTDKEYLELAETFVLVG